MHIGCIEDVTPMRATIAQGEKVEGELASSERTLWMFWMLLRNF